MTFEPCMGCGVQIDGAEDYCGTCWDDLLDWLGWANSEPPRSRYRATSRDRKSPP